MLAFILLTKHLKSYSNQLRGTILKKCFEKHQAIPEINAHIAGGRKEEGNEI